MLRVGTERDRWRMSVLAGGVSEEEGKGWFQGDQAAEIRDQ